MKRDFPGRFVMKKYVSIIIVFVFMLTLMACGRTEITEETETGTMETTETGMMETVPGTVEESIPAEASLQETEEEEIPFLTSAPKLYLSDALSSTMNRIELQSGNYSWSYLDNGETTSMVACGVHPLDKGAGGEEKVKLPDYNGIDFVSYLVSSEASPDSILVSEWDAADEGNVEAKPNYEKVYEEAFFIEVKPDKIYEITAIWKDEKLEERGFSGEASYVLKTE
ncbi:hypothetical protein DXB25_04055 [Lachnospiraceae bacterium OM02-31]|jgi:hypothetical protein|nr:hypothetical protein DXB25_04055 [Lachnospiraceae bacterium OM02-31]RJW57828.1 hypothetical protein DXB24_09350 [Lachnospiraceae bacterium OM02-3]